MRSVLCFGNAWSGGFMQKCVFQVVNSTHAWNMEWDASSFFFFACFLEKYLFFTDIQECVNKRRGQVFFFFFFAGG